LELEEFRGKGGQFQFQCFTDLKDGEYTDKPFNQNAPEFRVAWNGINIEGYCENTECKAYDKDKKKRVICPLKSKVLIDILNDEVLCPLCSKHVEPITCAFVNCQYTWNGVKKNGTKVKNTVFTTTKECYRFFDEKISGSCEWKNLKLVIKELDEKKKNNECANICAQCHNEITKDMKLCDCENKHSYHKGCLDKILLKNIKCLLINNF